jgi:hypothetical protein
MQANGAARPLSLPTPPHPQEHLILVCELLRANLYEFQKYQRDNGDEPYFTLPRIQRIAVQVGAWVRKGRGLDSKGAGLGA